MKKITFILCLFVWSFLSFACKTIPKDDAKSVYVMIYDYSNVGVKDVDIFVNSKEIGKTDIYGRLVFPVTRMEKENDIVLLKKGYEKLEFHTAFHKDNVFYFKIGSAAYYAKLAEEQFDNSLIEDALTSIDKAIEIESRLDYLYLKNIIQKKL